MILVINMTLKITFSNNHEAYMHVLEALNKLSKGDATSCFSADDTITTVHIGDDLLASAIKEFTSIAEAQGKHAMPKELVESDKDDTELASSTYPKSIDIFIDILIHPQTQSVQIAIDGYEFYKSSSITAPRYNGRDFTGSSLQGITQLQELIVKDCAEFNPYFSKYPCIKHLEVTKCSGFKGNGIQHLSTLHTLKVTGHSNFNPDLHSFLELVILEIGGSTGNTSYPGTGNFTGEGLSYLKKLKNLTVFNSPSFNPDLSELSDLEHLVVRQTIYTCYPDSKFTGQGIQHLTKLKTFSILGTNKINADFSGCKSLTHFKASFCNEMIVRGLAYKSLESFEVSMCANASIEGHSNDELACLGEGWY